MSWSIKENANAPGTAYVVDDDGQELAFCQTIVHAKQIIVAAGSAAIRFCRWL